MIPPRPTPRLHTLFGALGALGALGVLAALPPSASASPIVRPSASHPSAPSGSRGVQEPALSADTLLSDTIPEDAFADAGTETLVRRAMEAREGDYAGLEAYEARMRERMYVGLGGRRFRRERALFEQERAARVRWEHDGTGAVQWLGARRSVPAVAGLDGAEEDIEQDLVDDLAQGQGSLLVPLDPAADRLSLGSGDWALHPLADTALHAYRYAAGDTLVIRLADGTRLTLIEIRVQPREAGFHRVAGSLWFDRGTGALVRATYRPSRPWGLVVADSSATLGGEEGGGLPGFVPRISADIAYIAVEYGLYESRWWLPRRFGLEGEARVGSFLRTPVTVEWVLDEYAVNVRESEIPIRGPLPPGWARSERRVRHGAGGDSLLITVLVPPGDSLRASALVSASPVGTAPAAFTEEELRDLRRELEALAPQDTDIGPRLAFGFEDRMLRFNRVEGLSGGAARAWTLGGGLRLRAEARLGVADLEPNAEVALLRGDEDHGTRLALYRRLDHASDWEDPLSLPNSAANLLLGTDRGWYFRTAGAELVAARERRRERLEVRLFAEHQEAAPTETTFHLLKPVGGDRVVGNIGARRGAVGGAAATLSWFRGLDPTGLVLSGRVGGEGAAGDWEYNRIHGSVAASHPLPGRLSGAVEAGTGGAWGEVPVQRTFFVGGPGTLRGFRPGDLQGTSFWFARAEVGSRMPAFRVAVFGDAAWAGPREAFGTSGYAASAGVGFSLLDGVLRFDVARAVRGGDDWRVHLYLDALF